MEQPPATDEQSDVQRRRRAGGRPWPPGVSGNPSGSKVNKRAAALFEAMAADFGGPDELSAIDKAMLEQASRLLVRSERTQDADIAIRLSNAAARLLASFRNGKRVLRKSGPSLADLLREDREATMRGEEADDKA